ncbi:uncharacterized protein ACHE_40103A [Aspergillus chevalieri]|uniref:DUF6603 domain-containing protein n=1 Tax=Aspergillus chevalieri TaxID=182096 RepID=A0A7R7VMY2_ASPCH|nr:uncharacterized protein ACHE_40103A [Aspergillus chevalieri]BCR87539.1 hypothetical protein ACHE_40103A [Aspergillus chevalieri]
MADFLINYRPFKFTASAAISDGIRCSIDISFIHTSVSAELSTELTLWAPPETGRVHANLVTSFDINFGDSQAITDPITLMNFYEFVLQSSQKTPSALQICL